MWFMYKICLQFNFNFDHVLRMNDSKWSIKTKKIESNRWKKKTRSSNEKME